jgi:hypothetical protein
MTTEEDYVESPSSSQHHVLRIGTWNVLLEEEDEYHPPDYGCPLQIALFRNNVTTECTRAWQHRVWNVLEELGANDSFDALCLQEMLDKFLQLQQSLRSHCYLIHGSGENVA